MRIKFDDLWLKHLLLMSLSALAVYWTVESLIDYCFFYEKSLLANFFSLSSHELWMRIVAMSIIIAVNLLAKRVIKKCNLIEAELKKSVADTRQEIKKRETIEEELCRNLEEIKIFAFQVVHDLKNPAIVLASNAKLLYIRYAKSLDDKGKEYCTKILNTSVELTHLVEMINIFISTKNSPLHITELKLEDICQTIREEFSIQMESRDIKLLDHECRGIVWGDSWQLIRVFRNVIANSLNYGGKNLSQIIISHKETDMAHLLSFQDNGVGLSEEDIEKIFRPFERLKTSRAIIGSGLGLSIVKEIAEKHGGKAWIESGKKRGMVINVLISKTLNNIRAN